MSPFSFTGVLTVFRHITLGIPQFRFAHESRSVSQTPDKIQWTSIKRLYRNWICAYIVLSYVTLVKASRQWEKPELPSPVRLQTKKNHSTSQTTSLKPHVHMVYPEKSHVLYVLTTTHSLSSKHDITENMWKHWAVKCVLTFSSVDEKCAFLKWVWSLLYANFLKMDYPHQGHKGCNQFPAGIGQEAGTSIHHNHSRSHSHSHL